jgi:hypothetical protein
MCRHCTALGKAVTGLHGHKPFPLPVCNADTRKHFDYPLAPDSACVTRARGVAARAATQRAANPTWRVYLRRI